MEEPSKMDWTIDDVADFFGVTRYTIYRWMKLDSNPLPHHRPGGGVLRFDRKEVREWGRSEK